MTTTQAHMCLRESHMTFNKFQMLIAFQSVITAGAAEYPSVRLKKDTINEVSSQVYKKLYLYTYLRPHENVTKE